MPPSGSINFADRSPTRKRGSLPRLRVALRSLYPNHFENLFMRLTILAIIVFILTVAAVSAQEKSPVPEWLAMSHLGQDQTLKELQDYLDANIPRMPAV